MFMEVAGSCFAQPSNSFSLCSLRLPIPPKSVKCLPIFAASSVFKWRKPSGKVELFVISASPQPCHRSAHRGSTWFHLSRCVDTNIFPHFQISEQRKQRNLHIFRQIPSLSAVYSAFLHIFLGIGDELRIIFVLLYWQWVIVGCAWVLIITHNIDSESNSQQVKDLFSGAKIQLLSESTKVLPF